MSSINENLLLCSLDKKNIKAKKALIKENSYRNPSTNQIKSIVKLGYSVNYSSKHPRKYAAVVTAKKEIHPKAWRINLISPNEEIGYKPTGLISNKHKRSSH